MKARIGVILGSGLNEFVNELASPEIIYEDKDSFHQLKVYSGKIIDQEIILFSGRRHFYEGFSSNEVLSNIDLAKKLGLKFLIITNAAGGLNKHFRVSDLMLITSHINFINKNIPVKNNLILYDKHLTENIKSFGKEEKINLRFGSYCCSAGPAYETKAEIRYLSKLGIDAVGMSTIPEILYANNAGIKTLALSCITNLLSENSEGITSHNEVLKAGKMAYHNFSRLLTKIISNHSKLF